ncbi:hypothetical protein CC80DRAFT_496394 [Byssothecium circinans]|uniref:Uncharacterized protein n=1 Tax=Byssothecium circinans TaxID=147558 RepID=A0A6A5TG03_9PLEO|nr:hypothetical protein CC80DRAFT_496394 [Byssothecium circinans]
MKLERQKVLAAQTQKRNSYVSQAPHPASTVNTTKQPGANAAANPPPQNTGSSSVASTHPAQPSPHRKQLRKRPLRRLGIR